MRWLVSQVKAAIIGSNVGKMQTPKSKPENSIIVADSQISWTDGLGRYEGKYVFAYIE
jgi:hypothetical protein